MTPGAITAKAAITINTGDLMRISVILGAPERKVWEIKPSPTILYISIDRLCEVVDR
jgi:hypothetical protein